MENVSANAPDDPGQNTLQSWLPVPVPGCRWWAAVGLPPTEGT